MSRKHKRGHGRGGKSAHDGQQPQYGQQAQYGQQYDTQSGQQPWSQYGMEAGFMQGMGQGMGQGQGYGTAAAQQGGMPPGSLNSGLLQGMPAFLRGNNVEQFVLGALIGAAATWVLSDEELRGRIVKCLTPAVMPARWPTGSRSRSCA